MLLSFSVFDRAAQLLRHVELTAEPASSVESLLAALPVSVDDRPCFVGSDRLESDAALADSPLVAGVRLSVGEPGPDPRARPRDAVGLLGVIAGPDAGRTRWLPPGTHAIARDRSAALSLSDLYVSRNHAMLHVAPTGEATITDAGSGDGTKVDGSLIEASVPLAPASVIEIGDDRLRWVPVPPVALRATRSPDGRLDFDRAFAPAPVVGRSEEAMPAEESTGSNAKAMLVSAAGPLVLGGVAAVVMSQPTMMLFALLGPVSAGGTWFFDRKQRARRQESVAAAREKTLAKIQTKVDREERVRRAIAPDVVDLTLMATGAGRGLWPRNATDGLVLRVGTVDEAAAIDLRGDPWKGFNPPVVRNVPVVVDLRAVGVLGVVGPPDPTAALVRWLLVQLATLRSPDDLRIAVITSSDDDDLAWTRWLPHVSGGEASPTPAWIGNTPATRKARVEELKELVVARLAEKRSHAEMRFAEDVVTVLDGALALRSLPGMRQVLRDGPSVGVYTICVDRHDMNECHGLCEMDGSSLRLTPTRDQPPRPAVAEGLDRDVAERLARALSPMRDRLTLAGAEAAVPYPVRFLDLLGIGSPTAADVRALWSAHEGPTTDVPLGADGSGTVSVDLARQGPHTMLGGATGAGKSILLQTLVTSLLLGNRPDEMNLVLVDFKGGSAFLPFERCPHVVALIRSTGETPADVFDEAAATRVLASVRAEVRRRESILAPYGGEIDEYWRARGRRKLPALPRLVMIFDEFARVLEVSPEFLKELVNVAAKGRSLGMHLVLATQSLQGKLSAELKNNIELRITLRQNESADSMEVLGTPDAASIPGRLRGRGMILCTKDETRMPRVFQSGYLGDPPPSGGAAPARVRIVEWPAVGTPRPEEGMDPGNARTDQALTIAAIEEAAVRLGLPAPFRPLRPPLPANLWLEDLEDVTSDPPPASAVPFGLLDDPAAQAQPTVFLDLDGTDRLLVAGGPQSGRTTAARALITSIATRFRPDEAHLYVFESDPAGLAAYAGLPHCGAVLSAGEPDRVRRFVLWMHAEVQRRVAARFATGVPRRDPSIVAIIDGWEHFENRSDPNFVETSLFTAMREVVLNGPPVRVHVVAIGGQDMMAGKTSGLYSRRLLLRFPKEDTRRQHVPSDSVRPPVLQGRAVDAASGLHVQLCPPQITAEELVASTSRPRKGAGRPDRTRLPRRFPPMPLAIPLEEVAGAESPGPTWVPLGVGGADVTALGVDLFEAGPHLLLVSGPSGSGRTNAAATVIQGLRRVGVNVLAVAPPRSPLPSLVPDDPGVRLVTDTAIKDGDLRDAIRIFGDARYAVVVDDCDHITITPSQDGFQDAPTLLEQIANPGSLGRTALVLCGDAGPILSGQRRSLLRIVNEVMTGGSRLLLTPGTAATAREHGFPLETDQFLAGPPGRGYLTTGRDVVLVQIAAAPSAKGRSVARLRRP